jgi:hypothetical protein
MFWTWILIKSLFFGKEERVQGFGYILSIGIRTGRGVGYKLEAV